MDEASFAIFRALHPRCCVCAGDRPTFARDPQPPAIFFRSGLPDRLSVPACGACRARSQATEEALSLLVLPLGPAGDDFEAWQARIASARRRFPGLVPARRPDTREIRTILKEMNLRKPDGMAYRDVELVALEAAAWVDVFDVAARQLVLAQHYRCFRTFLSRTGRLHARLVRQAEGGPWLDDLIAALPGLGAGRHSDEDLGDRIATRRYVGRDGKLGVFVTHIQSMFVVVGMTGEGDRWRRHIEAQGGGGPFE